MARNSNELICSGVPFQAHPEITFHFQNRLGMVARRRWYLTCSQVFPNNMTSSPLMLTRLQSFPTKLVCDMGTVPRMGRKGKRTNLVCRKSELWGSNRSTMACGGIRRQSPRGARSCPKSHATTGTAQELPINVNRWSVYSVPLRKDFGMQWVVY